MTAATLPRIQTDTPQIQSEVRAEEEDTRFLPAGQDTANNRLNHDTLQVVNWRFWTMNITALSIQHPAVFEFGCPCMRLAGDVWGPRGHGREKWNIVFGQPLEALRSAWEARPGGVAIVSGPGVELQGAPLTTTQVKTLYGQSSRCLWHWRSNGACHLNVLVFRCWRYCRGTLSNSGLGWVP